MKEKFLENGKINKSKMVENFKKTPGNEKKKIGGKIKIK